MNKWKLSLALVFVAVSIPLYLFIQNSLQISNSSYQNSLSVNDDYKYLYGFSGGIGFKVKNNLITIGFKNLGKAGSAFGITINRLLNKNFK